MPKVLFVCTANRYRSPIAAACFGKELAIRKPEGDWDVSSAGTWAEEGMPAAGGAILFAQGLGMNIMGHRSSMIDARLAGEANVIIVMEQGHKEALRSEFPSEAGKVYLLSEVATGASFDVPDPVGPEGGEGVENEIEGMIHAGFERICELAGEA